MNPVSSTPPEGGEDWRATCEFWRHPSAPRSPTLWYHTPSSIPSVALIPFQVEVTQKRNQELPGGQKVSPHHHHLAWYLCLVAFQGVNLQPAPVHRRPAEDFPLHPPLRQGANLRPVRKHPLWSSSFPWDPDYPPPSCNWWICTQATNHQYTWVPCKTTRITCTSHLPRAT